MPHRGDAVIGAKLSAACCQPPSAQQGPEGEGANAIGASTAGAYTASPATGRTTAGATVRYQASGRASRPGACGTVIALASGPTAQQQAPRANSRHLQKSDHKCLQGCEPPQTGQSRPQACKSKAGRRPRQQAFKARGPQRTGGPSLLPVVHAEVHGVDLWR